MKKYRAAREINLACLISEFRWISQIARRIRNKWGYPGQNSDHFTQANGNEGNMNRERDIDELVTAFVRHLHEAHANPARVGCPDHAALVGLANQPTTGDFACVLNHISQCAPCLEKLARLRRLKAQPSDDSGTNG
jgi:hypothetical protein